MIKPPDNLDTFASFLAIVEALRGPDGCPWDKEQTHRTLAPYAIEEAYELAEAIEAGDEREMIAELGDLLLQVVLHSEIGRQAGRFTIKDVVKSIGEKMVFRHPHVFGDVAVKDSGEVLSNWATLKEREKEKKQKKETGFGIGVALPALQRSQKIGDRTKSARFDWPNAGEVMKKVDEELGELKEVVAEAKGDAAKADKAALEHEIGDLLFSTAQLARHLGLEAEQCLRTANARFEKRFFAMKKAIQNSGRNYDLLSADDLEKAWQDIKRSGPL